MQLHFFSCFFYGVPSAPPLRRHVVHRNQTHLGRDKAIDTGGVLGSKVRTN
jgi:hypothetical protein